MDSKIHLKEFIDGYRDSIGPEGAEQLMKQVMVKANLDMKTEFSKTEALKICRELKKYPGFVGVIGHILSSRITIR